MLNQIAHALSYFSSFTMLLPFVGVYILCAATRKELLNKDIFALALYIVFITLVQAVISIYAINHKNNLMLFNLFMPMEFGFFIYIILLNYSLFNRLEWLFSFLTISVCYIVIGLTKTQESFPALVVLLESTFVIPLAFNSVIVLSKTPVSLSYRNMMFKGLLIYCLGNFVMIGFIREYFHATIIIHTVLNTYANYSFLKSFVIYRREMNGLK